ncbi:50S ribosomal protein L10 [Clostridiales bacterium COT073_COT-073]|nr:50S ribosomal protein L10 [Clostridiales bacterium COT073_COT-073]
MPKVEQKQVIINGIKEHLNGASSVVLVDYRGLTVAQDTELRKNLRQAGVTYKVFKNTMMRFAFEGSDFAQLDAHLEGPSAAAISYEDATAGARILKEASKTMPKLEFKAGVVDGTYYDANGIMKIASIPSKNELLSKLLGSFQAPMASFARVVKAVADKAAEQGVDTAAQLAVEKPAEVAETAEVSAE